MSHQSKIRCSIKSDTLGIEALKQSATELGCELLKNAAGRIYSGEKGADYVVRVKGASYDVLCDTTKEGTLAMTTDWYGGSVAKVLGKDLCKLKQGYAVNRATIEARRKGYVVSKQTLANGSVKLVLTGGSL